MQTTKSHREENVYIVVKILHNYNKNRKMLTCKMNKIWFILKIRLFLFYVYEWFFCVYRSAQYLCSTYGGRKKIWDTLELKLHVILSHHLERKPCPL